MTLLTTAIDESARPGRMPLAARKDVIGSRDWHLSVILILTGMRETSKADYFAVDALSQYLNDAELLLAAGTIQEELANAYEREADYQIGSTATAVYRGAVERRRVLSVASRDSAIARYTNALLADPGLHEAAIRRARVLAQQGKRQEARATIETVIEQLTAPPLVYLSQLFLGGIAEADGRLGDAVLAYRRATLAQLGSQSARVALAHVLERAGVADEALEVIGPLLKLPSPREYEEDPWWEYPRGRYRQGLRLLETLFQRVQKAPS
jgi:tetratricopeptide (TPR) repeat protein